MLDASDSSGGWRRPSKLAVAALKPTVAALKLTVAAYPLSYAVGLMH
jgi:hypothetical protein